MGVRWFNCRGARFGDRVVFVGGGSVRLDGRGAGLVLMSDGDRVIVQWGMNLTRRVE